MRINADADKLTTSMKILKIFQKNHGTRKHYGKQGFLEEEAFGLERRNKGLAGQTRHLERKTLHPARQTGHRVRPRLRVRPAKQPAGRANHSFSAPSWALATLLTMNGVPKINPTFLSLTERLILF